MTKRQIKKDACFHAAMALEHALGSGWETERLYYGRDADHDRFLDAMDDLIRELKRRGGTDRSDALIVAAPGEANTLRGATTQPEDIYRAT